MSEQELREGMEYVRACLSDMHERAGDSSLSAEEQTKWDEGIQYLKDGERDLKRYDEMRSLAAKGSFDKGINVRVQSDPFDVLERVNSMPAREATRSLIDSNLRAMEAHGDHLSTDDQRHFESVIKRHAKDTQWAANILGRQRDEYVEAFGKVMSGRDNFLTHEERTSLQVGNNTSGGYLLPTHLDPTIILTNSGTSNVIRNMARVVTLTAPGANEWNGVNSAGVTGSWDTELEEVSDDSPTFGRVNIKIGKAQAFAQASIEAMEDIANLAADLTMLFADNRDRMEGAVHATGAGTNNSPIGIVTALDANTNVELASATPGTLALADIHKVYRSVPIRWRGKGTWLMHPLHALAIKALGTAVSASFSGELPEGTTSRILGKSVVESDDMPSAALTTTAVENVLIYGDFSNYVIVDKPGSMAVEYLPQLLGTTNNRPIGARGWYCYWRTGADSVNDNGFRLLQDATSA